MLAVPPNTILVLDWAFEVLERRAVFEFDLRQSQRSYTRWRAAFETAVARRAEPVQRRDGLAAPMLGLSAGFDSGSLHCALLQLRIPHVAYSLMAKDDLELLERRSVAGAQPGATRRILQQSEHAMKQEVHWVSGHVERHAYQKGGSNLHDPATAGLSAICRDAVARGNHRILLSAAGGDELFSDYGNRGVPSDATEANDPGRFFGQFPSRLEEFFPWANFFLGTQRDFLMKEEFVAGAHGMEARYPFLDVRLVQEFLWLGHYLKNRFYKAPSHVYMTLTGYPFLTPIPTLDDGEFRRGFVAHSGLLLSRRSVVTDVSPGPNLGHCWSRVTARQRSILLARRWRNDVIHGCAVGDLDAIDRGFSHCARLAGNETEPDTEPLDCIDSYLYAGRDGLTCLGFAWHAGHDKVVNAVLLRAASLGLCGDASLGGHNASTSCSSIATARWGLPGQRDVGLSLAQLSLVPELAIADPECGSPLRRARELSLSSA